MAFRGGGPELSGRRTAFPGLSQQGLSPVPVSGPSVGARTRARKAAPGASVFLPLPASPSPGTRKWEPVPSAALGQLASALFLEVPREGDCSFLSPKSSCQKAFPAVSLNISHAVVNFGERSLCAEHWARSPCGKAMEAGAWPWGAQSLMGDTYVKTQNPGSAKVLYGHTGDRSPKGCGQVPAGLWRPCVASATFFLL